MVPSSGDIDKETLTRIRERVLREEDRQLHFKRPPRIVMDLRDIVEEEITDVDMENEE